MKPQPLGAGRRSVFGRTEKSYQALVDAACPGPVDRPHRANINRKKLYWGRWDHARRSIADNRWHGKVRCDPDITYEQAAGRGLESWLGRWLDSECPAVFFEIPVLGYFLLWVLAGGLSRDRPPQRKNIREYQRGLAPFHFQHVTRPDESEERRLIKLYQAGDVIAGNMLIAAHIWIARDIARKYQDEAERDDLIQEGTFGLYKALRKFNPERGYRFSTLAYGAVEWAMKDYVEYLRRLQRHESTDEIIAKGGGAALGMYRATSVEPDREHEIFFD